MTPPPWIKRKIRVGRQSGKIVAISSSGPLQQGLGYDGVPVASEWHPASLVGSTPPRFVGEGHAFAISLAAARTAAGGAGNHCGRAPASVIGGSGENFPPQCCGIGTVS